MAEAKLDFTADDKVAKSVLDRQTKQIAQLEEQVKKLNETSKKGFKESTDVVAKQNAEVDKLVKGVYDYRLEVDQMIKGLDKANLSKQSAELEKQSETHQDIKHWLSEQGRELLALGTGYLGIERGVEAVVGTYEKWREKVKELGREHAKTEADMVRTFTAAGLLKHGEELEHFLEGGGPGTPQQRRAALAGVVSSAPGADTATIKRLVTETVQSAPTGIDLSERGALIGKLSQLTPSKSPDDLADLAAKLTATTGNRAAGLVAPEFGRTVRALTAGGMSPDEALAMGAVGLQNDDKMKWFLSLGQAIEAPASTFSPQGGPHRLSPEERAKRDFGALSSSDRLKALRSDRKLAEQVLGNAAAFNLTLTPDAQVQDMMNQLQAAQSGDFAKQQVGQLGEFRAGRGALQEQAALESEAQAESIFGPTQSMVERYNRIRKARMYSRGRGREFEFGETRQGFQNAIDPFTYLRSGIEEERVASQANRDYQGGIISKEELNALIAALKANTEATKRNTRGGNSAAPIDDHGESASR